MTISRKLIVGLAGTTMVVVGIIGLVLPFLPGWLLIIGGLALLRTEFRWADRLTDRARSRQTAPRSRQTDRDELAA